MLGKCFSYGAVPSTHKNKFYDFFPLNYNLKITRGIALAAVTDISPSLWLEWVPRNSHFLNPLIGIAGSGPVGVGVRAPGKGGPDFTVVGSCSHGTR